MLTCTTTHCLYTCSHTPAHTHTHVRPYSLPTGGAAQREQPVQGDWRWLRAHRQVYGRVSVGATRCAHGTKGATVQIALHDFFVRSTLPCPLHHLPLLSNAALSGEALASVQGLLEGCLLCNDSALNMDDSSGSPGALGRYWGVIFHVSLSTLSPSLHSVVCSPVLS